MRVGEGEEERRREENPFNFVHDALKL